MFSIEVQLSNLYSEILKKSGDRFEREAAIHNLMFPMGEDLDTSTAFLSHNLWLLDERLTFASYIASDLPLNQHRILFNVDSTKSLILFATITWAFRRKTLN